MKILIVDDSRVMRRIISGAAQLMGLEVVEAENGVRALELMAEHYEDIGIITLDIAMPEMDGLECLEKMKADDRFTHIPVIMVSAESENSMLLRAVRLGAKHYVTKPFTPEDITTRLMEFVELDDDF